jgi:hypothetical protein
MFPHIRSIGRSRAQRWNLHVPVAESSFPNSFCSRDTTVAKPKEEPITRVMADRQ